ncbi:MAG: Mrp/NBP35 family ATP-binding protein [Thermoplasmata archaeon]|nr:Mrp/NBP35 family ATP-binding protein [Thermoplasmata archaeon]
MMKNKVKELEKLDEKIRENLMGVKRRIAILSGKGGVGKTTVAVNLAHSLAYKNFRVGLLDADLHGPNVARMLGIEGSPVVGKENEIEPIEVGKNLKAFSLALAINKDVPVIWRGPLKTIAIKQLIGEVRWGDLDFLIVDLPPGTGDEALTVAQTIEKSEAIIVTTPQDVALLDSRRAVNFARQLGMKILGIIENMSGFKCPYCGREIDLFKVGGGERSARELGVRFLGRIPISVDIVRGSDEGKPFVLENSDLREVFMDIVEKVLA